MLWAVRWYWRYGVSYRDLEQMMGERGVVVNHSTIYRWVQRYAPERAGAVGMQRRMGQGNLAEGLIAPTIERNVTGPNCGHAGLACARSPAEGHATERAE